jgi:hypothetical protein
VYTGENIGGLGGCLYGRQGKVCADKTRC